MKTWMRTVLSVGLACLMGAASVASACPIAGKVVCDTNSSLGVPGVTVLVTRFYGQVGPYTLTTSNAAGHVGEYSGYLEMTGSYDVEVGTTKVTVQCEPGGTVTVPDIAVSDPSCGGGGGADCSPGFYKNHETAWCPAGSDAATSGIVCQDDETYTCTQLVCLLSAEPPCKSKEPQRAFAKACLDAFSPANICSETETSVGVTNARISAESPAATTGCSSTGGSVGWLGLVGLGLLGAMRRRQSGQAPRD